MTFAVRRIEASEWREVKALRLRALGDAVAAIAFLDTVENASAQPDAFWQERAANAAHPAAAAQFVAITDAGEWVGSLTVLPHREQADAGLVVGVYVADGNRGAGIIDALFATASEWALDTGLSALFLDVHVDNARAQAVYSRQGYVRIGESEMAGFGREHMMVRSLRR